MKYGVLLLLGLWLAVGLPADVAAASSSAVQISDFRIAHGETRVVVDAALNRVAQAQANAMASKDVLDHDVLGHFNVRVASAGSSRAAENIAYGYADFPRTLQQWINSSSHRKNLLMHDATRVGVASATSPATHRTYWAMVIAGYEKPMAPVATRTVVKKRLAASKHVATRKPCRLKVLGLCL